MKFRPCIDLHNGKVKQIVGGTLTDSCSKLVENFTATEDAAFFANLYKQDNLKGGHIIMLGPGNKEQALRALAAWPGGMQVGGGINSGNAESFLEHGASHVIVTSWVFKDGKINMDNLAKLKNSVGKERIVLDLSCRAKDNAYYIVTDRWQKFTDVQITKENLEMLADFCDEFLIHAADVEGQCRGIEEQLVADLGSWTPIITTYAGGISSLDDLQRIYTLGQNKLDFTVGSALDIFGGDIAYKDVINWKPV